MDCLRVRRYGRNTMVHGWSDERLNRDEAKARSPLGPVLI